MTISKRNKNDIDIYTIESDHLKASLAPALGGKIISLYNKHLQKEFLSTQFVYNKEEDSYTCPAGETLTSLGTWHYKKGDAGETSYRFKTYRTDACKTCALKNQCTKLPKRIIHRSEYQDAQDDCLPLLAAPQIAQTAHHPITLAVRRVVRLPENSVTPRMLTLAG